MCISSFTLFTALTASPRDASGGRLKESVITGNWPWWFTVIGALDITRCVKALSGTWPPLGKAVVDAAAAPNAALDAMVGLVDVAAPEALATEAPAPLCGPNVCVAEDPPETKPELPVVAVAPMPVRMYKSRMSCGVRSKPDPTSSTTWYWF